MLDTALELRLAQERMRERAEKADLYRQLKQNGRGDETTDWQPAPRPVRRPRRASQRLNGARP